MRLPYIHQICKWVWLYWQSVESGLYPVYSDKKRLSRGAPEAQITKKRPAQAVGLGWGRVYRVYQMSIKFFPICKMGKMLGYKGSKILEKGPKIG